MPYDIVMVSSIPWNWSADYLRQTALELAKRHSVWCFVWHNPLSLKEYVTRKQKVVVLEKKGSVWVYTAVHWLPFRRLRFVQSFNEVINCGLFQLLKFVYQRKLEASRKIVWGFDPSLHTIHLYFKRKGHFLLYDSLDFFAGTRQGTERNFFELQEKNLIIQADSVVANSHVLYERVRQYRSDVVMVPQGFDHKAFLKKNTKVSVLAQLTSPIVGYVGGINSRLDFTLLKQLIKNHSEWTFVFWGPIQENDNDEVLSHIRQMKRYPHVLFGDSSRAELGKVLSCFDVGIIPYVDSDFNRYCFPMKVLEYFYFGLPVVSCEIDELTQYYPEVLTVRGLRAWENGLRKMIKKGITTAQKRRQRRLAEAQTWSEKIAFIEDLVEAKL